LLLYAIHPRSGLVFIVQGDAIAGTASTVGVIAIKAPWFLQSGLTVINAIPVQLCRALPRTLEIALLLTVELLTGGLTGGPAGR